MSATSLATSIAVCLHITTLVGGGVEVSSSITALTSLLIPYTAPSDVVISCQIAGGDSDYTALWELSGRQLSSSLSDRFIINDSPDGRSSTLTVTESGRRLIDLELISVQCHANNSPAFRVVEGKQVLHIVQFNAPGPVGDLELTYHSEAELRLQWTRPANIHDDVNITYLVHIMNSSTTTITQRYETADTYVSVSQRGEGVCQPHLFSVTAMNKAGNSSTSTLMESIPISLNISPVAYSQRVDHLLLDGTSANITVSFQPASNCSTRFPVLNYTVTVVGLQGGVLVVDPLSDSLISVLLSPAHIPFLSQDQNYSIIITACTAFTCRSPAHPLVALTTDTQTASAVFYSTAVSLNCTFADGSSAVGCLFVFHLTNENISENITIFYDSDDGDLMSNTTCDQLSNTRGAYDDLVLVYDVEEDGSTGSQPISATVTVENEPNNFTCPLPLVEGGGISGGAIVGIVVATVLALVFLGVATALLLILILVRRERRTHPEYSWYEGVKVVLDLHRHSWSRDETDSATKPLLEIEEFPVVKLSRSEDSQPLRVQLLDCPQSEDWVTAWLQRKRGWSHVHLYPEKMAHN